MSSPEMALNYSFSDLHRSFSAAQIEPQIIALSDLLLAQGITRVALLADNSIEWALVDIACRDANICLLPLPEFFSGSQRRHAIVACSIKAVITDKPEIFVSQYQADCVVVVFGFNYSDSNTWFSL